MLQDNGVQACFIEDVLYQVNRMNTNSASISVLKKTEPRQT